MKFLGGIEQCLGGDAADVEAGAAQRLAPFRAGGLQAELRRADRGDIATRPGTDHEDVIIELVCHFPTPFALSLSKGCAFLQEEGPCFDKLSTYG